MKPRAFIHSLLFVFIAVMPFPISAQAEIVEKIQHVRNLFSASKYDAMLIELDSIEPRRLELSNDTIDAVCFELRGQALSFQLRYRESITFLESAYKLFEKAQVKEFDYLDCLYGIAVAYHRLEDYENAERFYRKALLKSVSANVSQTNNFRANIYINLADIYQRKGLATIADECRNRAQNNDGEPIYNINELNYIIWENTLWDSINMHINDKDYNGAISVYTEMINGIKERIGKGERYAFALYSKALLLRAYVNSYDEASLLFKEIIDLRNDLPFPNNEVCGSFCNYALCLSVQGNYNEVEQLLPEAYSYLSQANNEDFPIHSVYRFIGNGSYWRNNYKKAIIYYEKYLDPSFPRENGIGYDEITNMLAVSYIKTNNAKKAVSLLERYLSEESNKFGNNFELAANIYHNLGRAYMLTKNIELAKKYLNLSKDIQLKLYGFVTEKTQQYIIECGE